MLKKTARKIDEIIVNAYLSIFNEKSVVICFCFHAVFEDIGESKSGLVVPQLGLAVHDYQLIFDYFLEHDYQFVSYSMLQDKLEPGGKYIYVTFDDGYFNNDKLSGIIDKYKIPIHLFVVTNNILTGHRFWWDVIFNERTKRGWSESAIFREINGQKVRRAEEIELYITSHFGEGAHMALSNLDRPYTMDELVELEKSKWVTIGNHTSDHTILEVIPIGEAMEKVETAQETLECYFGRRPTSFAFPNGNFNDKLISALSNSKMEHIFTLESGRNKLIEQTRPKGYGIWGRFCFQGDISIEKQCRMFRASNVSLNVIAKRVWRFIEQKKLRRNYKEKRGGVVGVNKSSDIH